MGASAPSGSGLAPVAVTPVLRDARRVRPWHRGDWLIDVAAGILIGGIVGGILAVNLVIYYGLERGYESSFAEIFEASVVLGTIVVGILLAFPVLGVVVARRQRTRSRAGGG